MPNRGRALAAALVGGALAAACVAPRPSTPPPSAPAAGTPGPSAPGAAAPGTPAPGTPAPGAPSPQDMGPERPADVPRRDGAGPLIRVALATVARSGQLSGSGAWRLYDAGGRSVLARGIGGDAWTVEMRGRGARVVSPSGAATAARSGALVARPADESALVTWNGKRYRGEIALVVSDSGLLVLNTLPLESYLRGVVPLEIGTGTQGAEAAVRAQAVASRTYALNRLAPPGSTRKFDVHPTVADQVYGGADAERPASDAAVAATEGQVLRYAGRLADARYYSTCGGSTADMSEAFRGSNVPYLRAVSDRIPGTERYYCDISPRFTWTRTFTRTALTETLERYLRTFVAMPAGASLGAVRMLVPEGETASGRVAALAVQTDAARYVVRGNDVRYVLRTASGEILGSTYFSVESTVGRSGRLEQVTFHGRGSGHGVGMCQWGAIGRARAGQDYRTILAAYYPGTTLGAADR